MKNPFSSFFSVRTSNSVKQNDVHEPEQLSTARGASAPQARNRTAPQSAPAERAQARHRSVVRALINAQDQHFKRVAEEWQDRVGTKLFQVLRQLRACEELIAVHLPQGKETFDQLAVEVDATAAIVRTCANELYPFIVEDFGFVAALREYETALGEQEEFAVSVQVEEFDYQLSLDVEVMLFRVMQEALLNVRKHAQSQQVSITFTRDHSLISLRITDDGQGFEPEQPTSGHYGLLAMRERVEACGGVLRVQSIRGEGTEVRVDLPAPKKPLIQASL